VHKFGNKSNIYFTNELHLRYCVAIAAFSSREPKNVRSDPSLPVITIWSPRSRVGIAASPVFKGIVRTGATIVTGGKRGRGDAGYFYEPTVIVDCRQEMEIMRREIFGPVLPVMTFSDLDEGIAYANDSDYGLTSSVYTCDLNVALKVSREIRFGETYVNGEHFEAMQGFHAGWRKSGMGGADGKHGLYEFMQTHVVYMQGHQKALAKEPIPFRKVHCTR